MRQQAEQKEYGRVFSAWLDRNTSLQIEELAREREWTLSKTIQHLIERALNCPNGKKAKR